MENIVGEIDMRVKWEYKSFVQQNEYVNIERIFNEMGDGGWELVTESSGTYMFKRRKNG